MKTFAIALLTAGLSTAAVTSAFAYDRVRDDIRRVESDRAQVRQDYARLQQEQRELRDAQSRADAARRNGHFIQAWKSRREVRRETADVANARARLEADREQLYRDKTVLRRDLNRN